MDEVEGIGAPNVENWALVFAGQSLSYTVTSGLTPKSHYRFKVLAKSEYDIESHFSDVSEFIAAALPSKIAFPANPFPVLERSSLLLTWTKPTIDPATQLPITHYRVYWDEGFRSSG